MNENGILLNYMLYFLGILITVGAQIYIKVSYNKYKKESTKSNMTGFEVARKILDANGLKDVHVVETPGNLTDHYDPQRKVVRLSKEIFNGQLLIKKYDATEGLHAIVDTFSVCDYIKNVMESEELGYEIRSNVLCAADFGVPQKRERFIVMGVRKDISSNFELPKAQLQPQNYYTVRDAIEDLENVPVVTDRLEDYGTPLPNITPKSELARRLRDSHLLLNHMVTKTRAVAMERFKALLPGQNFHNLDNNLKSTYTDASRTQNTIYLRLEYDKPSGTVVNVRKSMWIHPTLNRAVSVREAARLQSFPDSFIFCGTKDKQYQQVGNAVPPLMAQAIADDVAGVLDAYGAKVKNG